jgi:cobalt-zinc-cadmium resistance protein CzcA
MENIKYQLSILFCFLIGSVGYSQSNPLTLEQVISLGVENNGNIKAINLEIEKLNTLKKTSFGLDKTDVGVQYGQYNSLSNDFGFTIDQNFKFPTVYKHQKSLNQAYVNAGEQQKLVTQNDLIKEIKLNYYQIIFLNNVQQLLKFQDSLFQSFFKGTQLKYETGDGTYLEQVTAESKWMGVKAKLSENESNIKIYKSVLQALIFQAQPVDEIDDSKLKKVLNIEIDSSALVSNPQLMYYKKMIEIKEQEYRVNKSNILPDFSVGYFNISMIGNYNINGVDTYLDGGYRFQGVQATVSIPIFIKDDLAITKAKQIEKQIAETQVNNYQIYLKSQFERVVQDYYKYKSLLDYYENIALIQSDLMIDNATKSYNNGNINYLEYIQVMNNSINIKNNYLNLVNNYNQSIIAIEYLMGIK